MSEGWSAEQLFVRVADLELRVAQLSGDLEDVTALATGGSAAHFSAPAPRYGALDEWVAEYFRPTFGRPIGGEIRWCREWQEHAEAIGRLEALWRAWESLRLDSALGMATWLTNFLDPQLAALLGRAGPFAQCSLDRHQPQGTFGPLQGLRATP